MAQKFGFATFNPESGNGDQVVSITGDNYEGREQRSVTVQVATTQGGLVEQVVVKQNPVAEFVTIDETATVAKEGGQITINGRSNSTTLTFSLLEEGATLTLSLPANYTANGDSTAASGTPIANDPGASNAYDFSITFTGIAANATVGDLTNTLTVQTAGAQTDSCVITQTAGDPTLDVDVNEIVLEANGAEKQLQITSNTNWSITQVVGQAFKAAVAAARAAKKK